MFYIYRAVDQDTLLLQYYRLSKQLYLESLYIELNATFKLEQLKRETYNRELANRLQDKENYKEERLRRDDTIGYTTLKVRIGESSINELSDSNNSIGSNSDKEVGSDDYTNPILGD